MRKQVSFAALVLLCFGAVTPSIAAESIVACGQEVRGRAVLEGDLDCTGAADPAIYAFDASIDLNGHTLTANILCERLDSVGRTAGGCVVKGPGEMHGCLFSFQPVRVEGVVMTDPGEICDASFPSPQAAVWAQVVTIRDSVISGYPSGCVNAPYDNRKRTAVGITVIDSTIEDCATSPDFGAPAVATLGRLKIRSSMVQGGVISGRKARVQSSTILGPGDGYPGIWMHDGDGSVLVVVDSDVNGLDGDGIQAGDVRLRGANVSGNCLAGGTGCVDIRASGRVKASASSCDSSYCSGTGSTCGICSGD